VKCLPSHIKSATRPHLHARRIVDAVIKVIVEEDGLHDQIDFGNEQTALIRALQLRIPLSVPTGFSHKFEKGGKMRKRLPLTVASIAMMLPVIATAQDPFPCPTNMVCGNKTPDQIPNSLAARLWLKAMYNTLNDTTYTSHYHDRMVRLEFSEPDIAAFLPLLRAWLDDTQALVTVHNNAVDNGTSHGAELKTFQQTRANRALRIFTDVQDVLSSDGQTKLATAIQNFKANIRMDKGVI
jgi:hypothetical protein